MPEANHSSGEQQHTESLHSINVEQLSLIAQLRQENMILAAEKSNMQAELIFYKNELAKNCLRSGV